MRSVGAKSPWVLLAAAVVVFAGSLFAGWHEDLAARRRYARMDFAAPDLSQLLNGKFCACDVSIPFDWTCKGIPLRSVCCRLNGFSFLDSAVVRYENGRDPRCAKIIHDYVMDWVSQEKNPADGGWPWHDDATARRVKRFSYYYCFLSELWADEERTRIKASLAMQAELLTQESFYKKRHNHGMFQDFGLLCYALLVCDDKELRQRYSDLALRRAREYFLYSFCANGVHKEHSPAYCRDVSIAALSFSKFAELCNPEMAKNFAEYHERAKRFLTFCTLPDGRLPSVGDSSECQSFYRQPPCEAETSAVFRDEHSGAGYAIFRSPWGVPPAKATWILFQAATFSSAHKHSDDLSFMLYHKGDLFVEAGNRNYNYADPMTTYVYSGYAQNVLCVDGKDFPVKTGANGFRSVPPAALKTRMTSHSIGDGCDSVTGVQERFPGIVQTRTLVWDRVKFRVRITDRLKSGRQFKATLLFHVAEGVTIEEAGAGLRLRRGGRDVAVMSFQAPPGFGVKILRGEESADPYHTWIFRGRVSPRFGSLVIMEGDSPVGETVVATDIDLL